MGCFDHVYFDCPNCGDKIEAQSKGGDCLFNTYSPDAVPVNVASQLDIYNRCKCGKAYKVKQPSMPLVAVEIIEADTVAGEE